MPFKSKAQMRLFKAKEANGELPKGTYDQWLKETPSIDALPEKVAELMPSFFDEMSKLASKIPMSISKPVVTKRKLPHKRLITTEERIDQATKPAVTDTIINRNKNVARRRGVEVSQAFN
jgi:hypothetical protein